MLCMSITIFNVAVVVAFFSIEVGGGLVSVPNCRLLSAPQHCVGPIELAKSESLLNYSVPEIH